MIGKHILMSNFIKDNFPKLELQTLNLECLFSFQGYSYAQKRQTELSLSTPRRSFFAAGAVGIFPCGISSLTEVETQQEETTIKKKIANRKNSNYCIWKTCPGNGGTISSASK
ncbi:uncharacterized protein LOC135687902 isoform X2 [Rhopilema esculentum]|uniref:uncharacterized protein LOC135687902 isoform X2 n=1 Tax=Rhopilema esculentum TaxID=499914 RepID=UPI0031D73586